GYLVIEVRDDGQGLDFEKIRQRAAELFYSPERISSLNEVQLTDLLFEPGFSTASSINDLSGRGMGLDVVRTQLKSLQASVSIDSQPHQGTTFRLQIPLSLTISNLLLLTAGNHTYALLADAVEQILIPQEQQIRSWEGGKVLRWGTGADEQLVPVYQLANALDYYSPVQESLSFPSNHTFAIEQQVKPIILIRCQDKLLGLEVDQLLGDQELVIRPLGAIITSPSYIYGGSILADGRLALVLDGTVLVQRLSQKQSNEAIEQTFVNATPYILPPTRQQKQLPTQTLATNKLSSTKLSLFNSEPDLTPRTKKIALLVDDSITVRQTLSMTLERAGYQVFQAKDGYEALEQLRSHQEIQVVLCDIEMPRMNGFEFLKHHQQDPSLKTIPVIILTSRSGEKHRLIAVELGATAYITKPYIEHQLLTTVEDVLLGVRC
ncbi:MAG: response regulator, partial [Symploca sp. SIO2G7]|nr:response regulator [Symploca sp. SIO2G7]